MLFFLNCLYTRIYLIRFVNGQITITGVYTKMTEKKIDDVDMNKIHWNYSF